MRTKAFFVFASLLLFCSSVGAIPITTFDEEISGGTSKFVLTIEDDDVTVDAGGTSGTDVSLGSRSTSWFGDVGTGTLGLAADRAAGHIRPRLVEGYFSNIQDIFEAGGVTFPGDIWYESPEQEGIWIDAGYGEGSHKVTESSPSLLHAGGTFPRGAVGSHYDLYRATLIAHVVPACIQATGLCEYTTAIDSYKFTFKGTTSSVPEPTILTLMAIGLAGISFSRRRCAP
jgi:hypothetical protein